MAPNTPAWQIVFEALTPEPDIAKLERLAAEDPDEEELFSICHDHGILLIVNQALKDVRRKLLSSGGQEQWRSAVATYTLLSLTMHRELQRLISLFTASDIHAVPFKGPTLSERLYGDPALRMFADLDLMVPTDQVDSAVNLLIDEGYVPSFKPEELQLWLRPGSRFNHCVLQHPSDRWLVEIHWGLFDSWRRIPNTPVFLGVTEGEAMETLLYLCNHGAAHWWIQLKWVVDVDRCVKVEPGLDWEVLFARARERGCVRIVLLALFLARQVCGLELSERVVAELREDVNISILARRVSMLWPPPCLHPSLFWKFSYLLACRERLSDKIGMITNYPLARSLPFLK